MQKISVRSWTPLPILIASLLALSGCGASNAGSSSASSGPYMLGGSVTGLASGDGVELLDNNGASISVSADGPFSFASVFPSGSRYAITVTAQPEGQVCTVKNGSGKIRSANVTNVLVNCAR